MANACGLLRKANRKLQKSNNINFLKKIKCNFVAFNKYSS